MAADGAVDDNEHHVRFDALDTQAEEERSARGHEHRKELVRGVRMYKATEKSFRNEQIRTGYDFLKSLADESGLEVVSLGVRLTVHGFLCLFHSQASASEETPNDLNQLIDYFKSNPKTIEDLDMKLQEHLVLIALYVSEDEYNIPAGGPLN